MPKMFVVEPRNEDGTLNVKDPNGCFTAFPATGVTEHQLFNYWFKQNPLAERSSWQELTEDFKKKGWYIREKRGRKCLTMSHSCVKVCSISREKESSTCQSTKSFTQRTRSSAPKTN